MREECTIFACRQKISGLFCATSPLLLLLLLAIGCSQAVEYDRILLTTSSGLVTLRNYQIGAIESYVPVPDTIISACGDANAAYIAGTKQDKGVKGGNVFIKLSGGWTMALVCSLILVFPAAPRYSGCLCFFRNNRRRIAPLLTERYFCLH